MENVCQKLSTFFQLKHVFCHSKSGGRKLKFVILKNGEVTCVSYLTIKKSRAFRKSEECVYWRRDAKEACRGKVLNKHRERFTSLFGLESRMWDSDPESHEF